MFKFELPCDWSVNRRPNSSGASSSSVAAGTCRSGTLGDGTEKDSSISTEISKSEFSSTSSQNKLQCGKPAKNKVACAANSSSKDNHTALCAQVQKEKSEISTSSEAKSFSIADQSASKAKAEESADTSSYQTAISGHILGPKSNLKLDESFFMLGSNSDHHVGLAGCGGVAERCDDNDGGVAAMKQPGKNGLPGGGQIKKLVIKHLQNASYLSVPDGDEEVQPQDGIKQSNIRSQETYLDTESLLSKLPYKKMLSDMFGGSLRGNLQTSVIPYVTRAYEEAFMHEPTSSTERECARGKQCECMFIDRLQPFVGVEFLLPGEQAPLTPHLCVLCCRSVTQQLYYDVIFDKCEFPGTIQRFGNIHSEPGEYSLDAMLIASPTAPVHIMPLPIVSHQRNRYTVYVSSGIKRLKQSRVHFHSTPSCSADSGR